MRMTEEEYEKLIARQNISKSLPKTASKAPGRVAEGKTEDKADNTLTQPKKSSQKSDLVQGKVKRPKYGNIKIEIDGIVFDSVRESQRYTELKLLEQSGLISGLKLQEVFVLAPSVVLHGRKKPVLRYVADFQYTNLDGCGIVEDVKSWITKKNPAYRIKIHLMKSVLGLDVEEI